VDDSLRVALGHSVGAGARLEKRRPGPTLEAMDVLVLGSAAGGGFPQWNCGCPQCSGVRSGAPGLLSRTQDSVAVSAGAGWFLINASPDVGAQLGRHRELWPQSGRGSPIAGVVLTNGDIDHVLGLFVLREWQPLVVYATSRVWQGLQENALLRSLQRFEGHLLFRPLELGRQAELCGPLSEPTGIHLEAFEAPGNPPLHLAHTYASSPEDNIGLSLRSAHGSAIYVSSTASAEPVRARADGADLLLVDGTFWSDDEPLAFDASRNARAMGHVPISGPEGSLATLASTRVGKRVYTHVNNTNPILDEHSLPRAHVIEAGFLVAEDGMRFSF
jgi:pyrroloquinoline quinone biosynthesis protein B